MFKDVHLNRQRSIYQYSSMDPRLSVQNCKFFQFLLSLNSQKRLGYKENNTKYRHMRKMGRKRSGKRKISPHFMRGPNMKNSFVRPEFRSLRTGTLAAQSSPVLPTRYKINSLTIRFLLHLWASRLAVKLTRKPFSRAIYSRLETVTKVLSRQLTVGLERCLIDPTVIIASVHINPSPKRRFSKTLLKPEE